METRDLVLDRLTKAYEMWDADYRANPADYMTDHEAAATPLSTLAEAQARKLLGLLEQIPFEAA